MKRINDAINESFGDFTKNQKVLSQFILSYCDKAAFMTAAEIAAASGVSQSTVVRFALALGYETFTAFRNALQNELKYRISRADYYAIRQRIQPVMRPDAHVRPDGCYLIRSIYFDNYKDKALREKRYGMQQREKFRIRYYNDDLPHISLEKKIKHNSLCMKLDAPLTEAECRSLLAGPAPWMASHPNSLVRELYCKMLYQQLRPRVLVSYRREPYVYAAGNVRVTFDSCIRTSLFRRPLLDGGAQDISAMDAPEELLLEVKYDAFLPDVIA